MVKRKQTEIYIDRIIEAIDTIEVYIQGFSQEDFLQDKKTIDACLMQLQHIGETVVQISKHDYHFSVFEKERIIGFRNLVSHQYKSVRDGFIRNIITTKLPILKQELQSKLL